jgi:predicted transcriptional regulator
MCVKEKIKHIFFVSDDEKQSIIYIDSKELDTTFLFFFQLPLLMQLGEVTSVAVLIIFPAYYVTRGTCVNEVSNTRINTHRHILP